MSCTLYRCKHAVFGKLHGGVEAGLAAHGGQERVGPLARDDLLHDLGRDGLDVGLVGHVRVGHDGGGIGIDEHDLEPSSRSALHAWVPE